MTHTHADIHIQAYDAVIVLENRSKLIRQEYRERIKRLRSLMHSLAIQRTRGEITMATDSPSLHPDLERLLDDPTHGL
jgi:hypothetical protein